MTRTVQKIDEFKTYTVACGCAVIARSARFHVEENGSATDISDVAASVPAMVEEAFSRLSRR